MSQITLMVASLKMFLSKYFAQNETISQVACCRVEVKEVQNLNGNEAALSFKTELDEIKTQIHNIKDEIIETLRNDMKIGDQQHQEIKKRIDNLEQNTNKFFLRNL